MHGYVRLTVPLDPAHGQGLYALTRAANGLTSFLRASVRHNFLFSFRAIAHVACKRTPAHGPLYKSRDTQEAMVASHLRHVLAVTAVRANARLLLARTPLVGADAADALRRVAANTRAQDTAVQALSRIL